MKNSNKNVRLAFQDAKFLLIKYIPKRRLSSFHGQEVTR